MTAPRQPSSDDPAALFAKLAREDSASDSEDSAEGGDAQVSQAGSSFADVATSDGGADAVPDTPDDVPEDNIADAESGDFRRRGQDAEMDRQVSSVKPSGSSVAPDPQR